MTEWIVLVWLTATPLTGFAKSQVGDQLWNVSISSSQSQFEQTWNSLDGNSRKNSRVFRGNEAVVKAPLILNFIRSEPRGFKCVIHNVCLDKVGNESFMCPISGAVWTRHGAISDPKIAVCEERESIGGLK